MLPSLPPAIVAPAPFPLVTWTSIGVTSAFATVVNPTAVIPAPFEGA